MNIQIFNLLEDYFNQITDQVKKRLLERRPVYAEFSDKNLTEMIDHCLDGYIDLVVTGQTDALDKIYRLFSRIIVQRGGEFSDVFVITLIISSVVRGILAEEYEDLKEDDKLEKFNKALDQLETEAHTTACHFLDVFHEFFDKRIEDNNQYLQDTEKELGIDLGEFRMLADTKH